MKIAYSHLVQHISENPSIDQISDKLFQLGHEHEIHDNIFDIEFTPNRGDCLSINGLLRDLGVFFNVDIRQDIYTKKIDELLIDFKNLSEDICPQITFLKLEIDELPKKYNQNLDDFFLDLNVNKNNFFTDVSNYLSYETGQPTHCYDASKMDGKLVFHLTDCNTDFETLLGKQVNLSGNNAVFSLNNDVINLAGIVGGKHTSCSNKTKTVIVECAYFQPESIIGKSVQYDIQSEASHKFERGVDPSCQEKVLRRFIQIISEHVQIKDVSMVSYNAKDIPQHKISINVKKINQIIGTSLSQEDYLSYIARLDFSIEQNFIIVPSYRSDIRTDNDLAEEVARVIGYDNIDLLKIDIPKNINNSCNKIENKLRFFLLDHGFYEVINSPFIGQRSKESIKVDNPLDSNREYLRTNIKDSLLDNLLFNEKRQKDSIKLFEISDIYSSNNDSFKKRKLSIIASGRVGLNYEDFSKKITKEYLIELFQKILPMHNLEFNIISRDLLDTKIKSEIISFETDIDIFSNEILCYEEISRPPKLFNQYNPISEQPSSFKDISYSVKDHNKVDELKDFLLNYNSDILKHAYIFDYFYNEKKQEIKIGFRFVFQGQETTLTSSEIEVIYNDLISNSRNIEGVEIPGI